MAINVYAPRRDVIPLEGEAFSLRVINFFEDIEAKFKEIEEALTDLSDAIDALDARVAALEAAP